jgi:hypothetical protein
VRLSSDCAGGALRQYRRRHRVLQCESAFAAALPSAFRLPLILGSRTTARVGMKRAVPSVQALGTLVDLRRRDRTHDSAGLAGALSPLKSLAERPPLAVRFEQAARRVKVVMIVLSSLPTLSCAEEFAHDLCRLSLVAVVAAAQDQQLAHHRQIQLHRS